jgi:hypothetical protein
MGVADAQAQFAHDYPRLNGEEYGDGCVYYFIRRSDLRAPRFDVIQFFCEVS